MERKYDSGAHKRAIKQAKDTATFRNQPAIDIVFKKVNKKTEPPILDSDLPVLPPIEPVDPSCSDNFSSSTIAQAVVPCSSQSGAPPTENVERIQAQNELVVFLPNSCQIPAVESVIVIDELPTEEISYQNPISVAEPVILIDPLPTEEVPDQNLIPTVDPVIVIDQLPTEEVFDIGSASFNISQDLNKRHKSPPNVLPNDSLGTRFPRSIFTKKMTNGESISRDWLVWSSCNSALYCLCCKIYSKLPDANKSIFATTGFTAQGRWKKLHDKVPQHENSKSHKEAYIEWKREIRKANLNCSTDSLLLRQFNSEREIWRQILLRLFDVVLYLSERGLAFRGKSDKIGDVHNGNFLGIIELMAKYDEILKNHIEKVKESQQSGKRLAVHYLSPSIQNQFIEICANNIRKIILLERERAKYFSLIMDATPDSSHKEQTTILIRYVNKEPNEAYQVEERLLDFVNLSDKTGEAIADMGMEKLRECHIPLADCRGQGYDNGANMKGRYKGCQAHILRQNPLALNSPCSSHTLNLSGESAACCCTEAVTFFGVIQKLYNFFSGSPQRWEILKDVAGVSLHTLSKTRWSARVDALKPIATQLPKILGALYAVKDNLNLSPETLTDLNGLINYVQTFECLLMANIWFPILSHINDVNLITQTRGIALDVVAKNLNDLVIKLQKLAANGYETILMKSKEIAAETGWSMEFREKRGRKRKTFHDEDINVEPVLQGSSHFKENVFKCILESVTEDMQERFFVTNELNNKFSCLWNFLEMSDEKIEEDAKNLINFYKDDIGHELVDELHQLKNVYVANFEQTGSPPLAICLLNDIEALGFNEIFPNIMISLRIFLTIPSSVASAERTFSVMKRVKNVLRTTMKQDRLSHLGVLAVETELARKLDVNTIVNNFINSNIRKAFI